MGDIEEAIAETVAVETDSGSENVSTGSVTCEGDLRIGGVIRTCGEVSTGDRCFTSLCSLVPGCTLAVPLLLTVAAVTLAGRRS